MISRATVTIEADQFGRERVMEFDLGYEPETLALDMRHAAIEAMREAFVVIGRQFAATNATDVEVFFDGWDECPDPDGYYMDDDMDGDHESALASAGMGTDEDYGSF